MEINMNPLISVIVPVYNVENYLDRCVESIVNQTYSNLEIILVDDGSSDSSVRKCDEWAKIDSRIVVIHKENRGQADARNVGIEEATGNYIGFVDSDDYIDLSMYSVLYDVLSKHNCNLVECSMKHIYNQSGSCTADGSGEVLLFNREETVCDFIKETHFTCTVPNILLESTIAKKVFFDVGKTHEDILWPYRVFCLSKRTAYIDRTLYFYYQRAGSTMNKKYSIKRFDGLDALEERAELVRKDFPKLYSSAIKSYLGSCMYQYQFLCRQHKSEEYKNYKRILHDRFCNGNQKVLFDGLSFKYRVWYTLFRIAPKLTASIRNTLKIGI